MAWQTKSKFTYNVAFVNNDIENKNLHFFDLVEYLPK